MLYPHGIEKVYVFCADLLMSQETSTRTKQLCVAGIVSIVSGLMAESDAYKTRFRRLLIILFLIILRRNNCWTSLSFIRSMKCFVYVNLYQWTFGAKRRLCLIIDILSMTITIHAHYLFFFTVKLHIFGSMYCFFLQSIGSSSNWELIIAPGQEASGNALDIY